MESKKQSGGIISIIGILIVVVFASVVGKSCGKSLSSERNTPQHATPAPPSRNELKKYNVVGLNLLLPGSPVADSIKLPPGASNIVRSLKTYKVSDGSMNITITYAVYVNPEVNLDGSAEGAITSVRNLPTVRSFTSSKKATNVAGLAGRELTMSYMNSKFQIDQYGLVFANGGEAWQIQIIGEGIQNRTALEDLKNAVFESIQLSPSN
jgi:hypothetical protein